MKNFKIALPIIFLLCLTFSCNKSDDNAAKSDEELIEPKIRTVPISELQSGVRIDEATTITGTPPEATTNLDFQISTEKIIAYQKYGFNIKFSSTDDIQSAYILFQDVEGNTLNYYFNVPLSPLETEKSSNIKEKIGRKYDKFSKQKSILNGEDYLIDVDFDDIAPGTFCFKIYPSYRSGDVGPPTEICVEVVEWAGNTEFVGKWIYTGNGITDYDCENGDTISIDHNTYNSLTIDADGNYNESLKFTGYFLDSVLKKCAIDDFDIVTPDFDFEFIGKWSYNEDLEAFVAISFDYKSDGVLSNNYDPNDRFNNQAFIRDGNLVIIVNDGSEAIYERE